MTLPLSYSRNRRHLVSRPLRIGGQGRIRTSVARSAADLQSAAINHSATCPSSETGTEPRSRLLRASAIASLEPAMGLEPATFRLQIGCSTIELRRRDYCTRRPPGHRAPRPAFKDRMNLPSANRELAGPRIKSFRRESSLPQRLVAVAAAAVVPFREARALHRSRPECHTLPGPAGAFLCAIRN